MGRNRLVVSSLYRNCFCISRYCHLMSGIKEACDSFPSFFPHNVGRTETLSEHREVKIHTLFGLQMHVRMVNAVIKPAGKLEILL